MIPPITTNILRAHYEDKKFSFGNPKAKQTVCLIGSCRIVPMLNFMRVYNSMRGNTFELLCFNPVEMWDGPGHEVSAGVNKVLRGFRFGVVDYLVCEHIERCGVLNTVRSSEQNIFDSLGCAPAVEIRLANWNDIHVFDAETAMHDKKVYANLGHAERVAFLRQETAIHKERFLSHCRGSSFPELEAWVEEHWLTTRLGWSSSHPSHPLIWKMITCVAVKIGLPISNEIASHPLCATDTYKATGIALTDVDFEANGWKF